MYDWILAMGLPAVVIATKADKLKRSQLAGAAAQIQKTLEETAVLHTDLSGQSLHAPDPIVFSAKTGAGKDRVWSTLQS